MVVDKIFFDMDGVLADFNKGVLQFCGMDRTNPNVYDKTKDDIIWAKIKEIPHFYAKLSIIENAKEMFDMLYEKYGDKCEILTAIPKPRREILNAGEDKIEWVRKYLSKNIKINIVQKEEKKNFCKGESYILIDDLQRNIEEWNACGGTGILHTSAQETIDVLKKLKAI